MSTNGRGGLRPVATIRDEPLTTLVRWRVASTREGSHHFVGWACEARTGRVSSAVVSWDPVSMTGRTKSGRLYHLVGEPGNDPDVRYTWELWLRCARTNEGPDVTAMYRQDPPKSGL